MARRARTAETPAARRIKRKILIAMALTAFLPMLVVAYLVYAYALPLLDPQAQERNLPWMLVMLGGTGLLMRAAASCSGIWPPRWYATRMPSTRHAGPRRRRGRPATPSPETMRSSVQQSDEVDTLMLLSRDAGHHRAAGLTSTNTRAARHRVQGARVHQRPAKEFSWRRGHRPLQPPLLLDPARGRSLALPPLHHPVSVVLLDLDGFKVNDDLGHGAGDETLRAMAEILLKQSRGINVICRYGGDEFAVLLVETSKSGARLYADRIRYVLSTWTFAHGRRVTASFGIASLPEDVAPAAEELIRAADEALYAAKRAGKNRVSVHEDVAAGRPTGRPGA
jgi:diguanylate cyclase (GGDEF)-like protein